MSKLISCYKDPDVLRGWASISECGLYRHHLQRTFKEGKGVCIFVMLNPSDADAEMDDPTVAKCSKYCKRWGFRSLVILNLFEFRTSSPKILKKTDDPYGPQRYNNIFDMTYTINAQESNVKVVCAWGNDGKFKARDEEVLQVITKCFEDIKPQCFKINKNGTPIHPLYQLDDAETIEFKL